MDHGPPRTLLEQLIRASRRTIEESCAAYEATANRHSEKATLSPRQLSRWMAGQVDQARPVTRRVAELHWGHPFEDLVSTPTTRTRTGVTRPLIDQLELLRQGVHDTVSTGAMSDMAIDDWDETIAKFGQATRYRPATELLGELTTDFAELQRVLSKRHTASALRRLTRVTAQMAGLIFLTLIELNSPLAARNWARTARVAADEAGDPSTRAWVRAHEAYVHFYGGNLIEALTTARQAQFISKGSGVGTALAAALEARALALQGQPRPARAAIERAESALRGLDDDAREPSAFGYNEAQLRFHEGNALTHLRETEAAAIAQDRALELYPLGDYLDRTLIQLDKASCLAFDGDPTAAATHAIGVISELDQSRRTGIILLRGRQVFDLFDQQQRALPAARDLDELIRQGPQGAADEC